jgi:hypothetical protein
VLPKLFVSRALSEEKTHVRESYDHAPMIQEGGERGLTKGGVSDGFEELQPIRTVNSVIPGMATAISLFFMVSSTRQGWY